MIIEFERHPKGWGYEDWIVNSSLYCAKILTVQAGKRCSLHFHKLKTETMLVVKGKIEMIYGSNFDDLQSCSLEPGQAFHIEPFLLHQFIGVTDSVIHEFSTEHFENDSYRVAKGD